MTNQEKFLLLVVLIVSGVGATLYVQNAKKSEALKGQVQVGVQNSDYIQTSNTGTVTTGTGQTQTTTGTINSGSNTSTTNTGSETTTTNTTKQVTASYVVPDGDTENLSITVLLTNGTISDISFSMNPTNNESREYFNKFKNSFPKSQVVGKTLNNVSLSRVGGASLTTNAFNKAIAGLRG
jgi:type VI protein secretion system component Hcp